MRRLSSGRARAWLTEAEVAWNSLRRRISPTLGSIDADERRRLTAHGFAVAAVAGSVLLRRLLSDSVDEPQLWLFHVAITLSAAYGGTAPALVARSEERRVGK